MYLPRLGMILFFKHKYIINSIYSSSILGGYYVKLKAKSLRGVPKATIWPTTPFPQSG